LTKNFFALTVGEFFSDVMYTRRRFGSARFWS